MTQPAFDFGDEALDDPANPTFTVSELADAVNGVLRRTFSDGIWVRGEIQGFSERGGHAYFTLGDDTPGRQANLRVQFFANSRMRLRPLLQKHRLRLADGMKVRIFGHLDFYAPGGSLGLKMSDLDPRFTLGDLAQQRDQVLRRLAADGSLDANGRRRLSPVPLRVGVVSSAGTAAWHDFHDELLRSGYGFHLVLADTRVQGPEAGRRVARAITQLSFHATQRGLDAIVVIRGGGARNELATFDAEPIARAIAAAPVPVLTGLGHEIDRSVADEVAHTSLKTPTMVAEFLVRRVEAADRQLAQLVQRLCRGAVALLGRDSEAVGEAHERVLGVRDLLAQESERLRDAARLLAGIAGQRLARGGDRLTRTTVGLRAAAPRALERGSRRRRVLGERLCRASRAELRHVEE